MASTRFTVDTNILRVRDVFALNASNNDYIQPGQNLQIGEKGKFKWLSTTEYLSSLYVSSISSSVLNFITNTQSTLSNVGSITPSTLQSTIDSLGSLGYVSTATLDTLSFSQYRLISSTTLYDCFKNLGNMSNIGYLGTMQFNGGSNLTGGYVSTINPGQYKTYYSSLTITPMNFTAQTINNVTDLNLGIIDIGGFVANSTVNSKMIVDVMLNGNINRGTNGTFTLNTFLTSGGSATVIGSSNVIEGDFTGTSACSVNGAKFFLSPQDLSAFPSSLQMHMTYNSGGGAATVTTLIPTKGGVFVTLDNRD
jgi:hypothetical protein